MLEFRRLLRPVAAPALLGAYLLAGCGDSSGPSTPRVATVQVTPNGPTVVVSTTVQLSATPMSSSGTAITGKTVTWSSQNNSIATVTSTGIVTGTAPGTVQINASVDGVVGTANITVIQAPVATVTISPAAPGVGVGNTVQLTATMRDAGNNVLSGRNVTWSSQNPSVATINALSGAVTGVAVGTTLITATSEGVNGTTTLTVATTASIAGIAPTPLTPGASATITGAGFNATAAGNNVTVGGFTAPVTAATTTSVTFTVPNGICLPSGNVNVIVSVSGGGGSALKTAPFQTSATPFTVAAGQQVLISNPSNFCLQLPTNTNAEAFLIGVQSMSELPTELTPVVVHGAIPSTGVPAPPLTLARSVSSALNVVSPQISGRAMRWVRHRQAELAWRQKERATLAGLTQQRALMNLSSMADAVQSIPASAKLGDTLDVKVPNSASCTNPVSIRAVVRQIGARSIWLEDVGNPTGGFSAAQYQSLSDIMDASVFKTDSAYFGNPSDLDNNSRIAIVVTKEINKKTNILGFTASTDQIPTANCPASNFGEVYYAIAPDPNKVYQSPLGTDPYTAAIAFADAPVLIAHELTHVIQFARRTQINASAFLSIWEAEGQATLAEEVVGHAATMRTIGQNYGFSIAFNTDAQRNPIDPNDWYVASFVDLALYYGFSTPTTSVGGAPEECGWLNQQNQANIGPCIGGRSVYGISWSFLRWLSDQFGPTFPGGEQGLHRQLINSSLAGWANIATVIGQPIDVLLSQWAAALYTDDRIAGVNPRLTFTSWNLFSVENGLVATAKLTPRARGFADFTDNVNVRAGSTAYFRVSGTNHGPMAVSVGGGATALPATMRVWVVRLQ